MSEREGMRYGCLGIVALLLLLAGSTVAYWVTAPARVLTQTLGTGNIITSYERFIDLSNNFDARLAQVRDIASQPVRDAETQTDLNTVRQSCREIAAAYNSDAMKLNKQAFRDRNLSPRLDASQCEGVPR